MSFEHALVKLEFDKVVQCVVRSATSEPGIARLRSIHVSTSASSIRQELAFVSEMKLLLENEGDIPLAGIADIREAVQKSQIDNASLIPRELLQIGSVLRVSRTVKSFLHARSTQYPLLGATIHNLLVDKVVEFNIDGAVDESGQVRHDASKELSSLRRTIADKYELLRKSLVAVLKRTGDKGFTQDDIITTREGRMVIPVKAEHRHHVPGFVHSSSASGVTVFIEPTETLELNNEIRNLHFQEQREIDRILKELTAQVRAIALPLLTTLETLARIDELRAKARYSIQTLSAAPIVEDDGSLSLVGARHPMLLETHGHRGTVPLTLTLGDTSYTLIISGPNAGGKSVAMKTVGLLVLMAQAGFHIPADASSHLRVFHRAFVDIGDDQSIENDLSTFSSHLRSLQEIARDADDRSLVLIDEIGSGTDPAEGSALAAALLEHLTARHAYTIATTHQGALKAFAGNVEDVENGAMLFDRTTLTPTYQFKPGTPGSSYALEIASRLGFEPAILEKARTYMGGEQSNVESLIAQLDSMREAVQKERHELEADRRLAQELVQRYESKVAHQAEELRELKAKALDEARHIVADAQVLIERAVREIREQSASREAIVTVHDTLRSRAAEISERIEQEAPQHRSVPADIHPGAYVTVRGGTEAGEVSSICADGKTVLVDFGNVRVRLPFSELRLTGDKPHSPSQSSTSSVSPSTETDLDIRGLRGDEAIPLLDKFIDTAVLSGLHRVDIIHGKGTGALRNRITDFLSRDPRVKTFRLGEWNEGGTGATVVELV